MAPETLLDEVLGVNNNAEQGTVEEVERTDARMVCESEQGYGHACRRGLFVARPEFCAEVQR